MCRKAHTHVEMPGNIWHKLDQARVSLVLANHAKDSSNQAARRATAWMWVPAKGAGTLARTTPSMQNRKDSKHPIFHCLLLNPHLDDPLLIATSAVQMNHKTNNYTMMSWYFVGSWTSNRNLWFGHCLNTGKPMGSLEYIDYLLDPSFILHPFDDPIFFDGCTSPSVSEK